MTHFKLWNKWRKTSRHNVVYKFLVLIGLACPADFTLTLTDYEVASIRDSLFGTDIYGRV